MNNSSWSIITNFSCYCYNMCSIGYLRAIDASYPKTPLYAFCRNEPDNSAHFWSVSPGLIPTECT